MSYSGERDVYKRQEHGHARCAHLQNGNEEVDTGKRRTYTG